MQPSVYVNILGGMIIGAGLVLAVTTALYLREMSR